MPILNKWLTNFRWLFWALLHWYCIVQKCLRAKACAIFAWMANFFLRISKSFGTCGHCFDANVKDFPWILTWWPNHESFVPWKFCTIKVYLSFIMCMIYTLGVRGHVCYLLSDDYHLLHNDRCHGNVIDCMKLQWYCYHSNSDSDAVLDEHRLQQRQKQLDFGKNTPGYQRYITLIPKWVIR